ncbi:hypothetical protein [Lignipirellula cremea]|uniref:Uncharacterized protein n=1 Tax=Lignipirellula cremea TaxID=2528010 RepID=A0A518DVS9_9BACT|nr:hypothetical protein [Lignipirellula cremea]QDU95941.1 hypothetical protein Pla8534_37600 [Lignipirellula cremea]
MSDQLWQEWPVCPKCARRRQAVCPSCRAAGDNFPLGYQMEEATPRGYDGRPLPLPRHRIWLMCPDCDEAFRPAFYANCAACGHAFDEGVAPGRFDREADMSQMSAVTLGFAVITIAVLLYLFVL